MIQIIIASLILHGHQSPLSPMNAGYQFFKSPFTTTDALICISSTFNLRRKNVPTPKKKKNQKINVYLIPTIVLPHPPT